MAFAEAAHFGVPSIAYATGGVPSVVKHGITGVLLPLSAGPEDFAREIAAISQNSSSLVKMSIAAATDSEVRLNWNSWAAELERQVRSKLGIQH
jgi:glycosyltransferase involved in cell wall biosynthesis